MKLAALFLPILFATACIDVSDEPLADTESDLSAFDWGATNYIDHSGYSPQVATLNGVTYLVQTGTASTAMYWSKRTGPNTWSAPQSIPGQKTSGPANVAAFNGYLYMVHQGETDYDAVWFSRFDPRTETWTPNVKLSMTSRFGTPALAAFDGRLWLIGSTAIDDETDQLWVSTMNTAEQFTTQTALRYRYNSTHVSAAVYANKLYIAYGRNGSLYTMTHAAGTTATTWSAMSAVKAGPSGTTSQGWDPKIAVAGGYLHLIHRGAGDSKTWWTYWNQCTWAPEIQFDQVSSDFHAGLASGGPGLVLVRKNDGNLYGTEYSAPPAPIAAPQCLGAVGT